MSHLKRMFKESEILEMEPDQVLFEIGDPGKLLDLIKVVHMFH